MATELCTYHSTKPAVWECDECCKDFCDNCAVVIDQPGRKIEPRCALCENWLTFLGTGHQAKPFWTVAPMLFTYPFSSAGISVLVVAAILGFLIGSGFFSLPLTIILGAILANYGVAVINHIAQGNPGTPSLREAMERDENNVFLKFVALLIAVGALPVIAQMMLNPAAGIAVSILTTVTLPAMIILLASEGSLLAAFQPVRLIWLISCIGWPYALVVFVSTLLASGPMFVLGTIGEGASISLVITVLTVSFTYFGLVNFCMLGYVIFENQRVLGFVAGSADDVVVADTPANRLKKIFGEVNVFIKENQVDKALKLIDNATSEFRKDPSFYERATSFALQSNDVPLIESLTNGYLNILMDKQALDQALDCCRKSMVAHGEFRPRSPDVAHSLAQHAYSKNLNKEALKLLVNLHKRSPKYARLGDAYRLAADILRNGLGNDGKAQELEAFVVAKGYS